MQQYTLDPKALLGGVIHSDIDQEIVQLSLQKDNEIPDYQADAIILLLVLNGSAKIITQTKTLSTQGLQVVRLEPNETHSIRALEDHTNILVIKQLTYASGLNKKLRFGKPENQGKWFSDDLFNIQSNCCSKRTINQSSDTRQLIVGCVYAGSGVRLGI